MIKQTQRFDDPSGIVSKLVFEDSDGAIAESVVYNYGERGVVCFSVQSGCKIGCSFCGTGKRFVRDLTSMEMIYQISTGISVFRPEVRKIQIMSMSMGEPMDNWSNVEPVIKMVLNDPKKMQFFLSTVGLNYPCALNKILELATWSSRFGLQFSLHHYDELERRKLLGNSPDLMSIQDIVSFARTWQYLAGRYCYFNYIATKEYSNDEMSKISDIVAGMHLTCSVMCNTSGLSKTPVNLASKLADGVMSLEQCRDISVFDPAGQDTIGGGCGQLLYVQKKLKESGK